MSKPIKVEFEGDPTRAVSAFDKVGSASRSMASKIDDSTSANTRLGERVGSNERGLMGTADLLDGLGAAFGLPTEGATALFRGLGDLTGGFEIVSGIMPAITGMFPKLGSAMTFISAHPLIMGLLAGGAIIGGLILLEKKFGVVSGAVGWLGDAFQGAWANGIRPAINFILGGVELLMRGLAAPFTLLNKVPGVGKLIPDGIANVKLPRLAIGGSVLETGLAVVHKGEEVRPAHVTSNYSTNNGGDIIINAGVIVSERELVDLIHAGLLRKQGQTGGLGFRAAA